MQKRHKRHILLSLLLVVLLALMASGGAAFGKAHVPAGQVQVSHRGTALTVAAPALNAHLDHGDIQLPACDFANVFGDGTDTSNVVDTAFVEKVRGKFVTGVLYSDIGFVARSDAGGITGACPVGTI